MSANTNSLSIVSWNVNGIRAAQKKGFLDWLNGSGADLVFLQETKAMPEQLDAALTEPEGWHANFHSAERKGYSGVALYSRTEPDEIIRGCGDEQFSVEGRSICAIYGDLAVWGCYFPNGGNELKRVPYKMDYYRQLLNTMNEQRAAGLKVLVGGDYNTAHKEIDLARPKQNVKNTGFLPEEREEFQRWIDDGWTDTFRLMRGDEAERYSWWSFRSAARARNIGWRIDYWLCDSAMNERILDADIHPDIMGSDHCPVSVKVAI